MNNQNERRSIVGHEGSTLNNSIVITADSRDQNGGSHNYVIHVDGILSGEINFQKGPLQEAGLNGISDEALIAIVVDRLEGFNSQKYACRENSLAITHLQDALHWLQHRTGSRQRRGVEGTHEV